VLNVKPIERQYICYSSAGKCSAIQYVGNNQAGLLGKFVVMIVSIEQFILYSVAMLWHPELWWTETMR